MRDEKCRLIRLIVQYMMLPPGDPEARREWEEQVRTEYPYGRPILTAKIGDLVNLRAIKEAM